MFWMWCFRAELYALFRIEPSHGLQVLIDPAHPIRDVKLLTTLPDQGNAAAAGFSLPGFLLPEWLPCGLLGET
jgi:hypothetical protein